MKRKLIVLSILLLPVFISANPIALPYYFVTELFFNENNDWTLELSLIDIDISVDVIDSIYLCSSSDTIKIPNDMLLNEPGYLLFYSSTFGDNFTINPNGDSLSVLTFIEEECLGGGMFETLVYGNKEGAIVGCPKNQQSIAMLYQSYFSFCKDKSPTLGYENDTTGMCGTITGRLYDNKLNPVANRTFKLDFDFTTDNDGYFTARILSRPNTYNQIFYQTWQGYTRNPHIQILEYTMEPDSVINADIYLIDSITTGVDQLTIVSSPVKIYPNPISKAQNLTIEIDLPVMSGDYNAVIQSIDGKRVSSFKITEKITRVEMPKSTGIYIVTINNGSHILTSKRIVNTNE